MGEIFALHNLFVKSEEYHKIAVELMTYVIDYKIKYGNFLLKCNKIEQAIEQYNNALDLNPTIKEIHANLGFISIIKGDYNSAKISLNQAVILDPDYLLAYENLLLLSQKQNNLKDTKLYLQKILEINPNHKTSN
jgi:tetratricopeptide (TPR) repeat protein